uniref:BPTI/Kunitz inhibitor domain-containing protein n=1 Tax=Gongylonema pulchrum TaxID=637853 RepID=A0A183DU08_9BILA
LYCEEGTPLLLINDSIKKCLPESNKGEMSCPSKFWCHVGATQNSQYCCPKSRKVKERCHLAPANGYGSSQIRRFWYDWKSSACKQLTYSGYGGNENNFLSKVDCEKACLGATPPISSIAFSSFANKLGIIASHSSTNKPRNADSDVESNPCELSPNKGTSVAGIQPSFR